MNNEITLTVEGWVARPPQRHGQDDATWVTFRVGSTAWWWDSQGERRDAPTTWFDVRVSQKDLADNVLLSLKNGDAVIVKGRLSQHYWTDREGRERTSMQVTARSVGPNLRWGKAVFHRRANGPAAESSASTGVTGADSAPPAGDQVSPDCNDEALSAEEIQARAFAEADALAAQAGAAGDDADGDDVDSASSLTEATPALVDAPF